MSHGVLMLAHDSMGIEPAKTPVGVNLEDAHSVVNDCGTFLELSHPLADGEYGAGAEVARLPFNDLTERLIQFFTTNLSDLVAKLGGVEQVAATAQLAYRTYVAPIDIDAIPNFIEPIFDNYMELAIGKLIRRAFDHQKLQPAKSEAKSATSADADVPLPTGADPVSSSTQRDTSLPGCDEDAKADAKAAASK